MSDETKSQYRKFEDWYYEIEGFAMRCERLDGAKADLEAAFEVGASTAASWIPVTERLPEPCVDVLVSEQGQTEQFIGWLEGGRWSCSVNNHPLRVTHWMPLPAPPKAGNCQANRDGWIPVVERLPVEAQRVRFSDGSRFWSGQFVDDDFWQDEGDDAVVIRGVTHWMPLPAPPDKP